ncbi:hypothetical protein [Ancylomarina longa]|uniref:DUF5063 domain-containing protein n=1 Tax=Ancylomarina longa TaxID=2487017 RepID=A0A434AZA3_9BACT|nr:hypothetical protein [Ancylomarina longa]RUT79866.1 hypothetical protein DLK05_00480 [Ancylomarina longa]
MSGLIEDRAGINQNIIEFYKIQPGVKELQLEKIEEYLILMSSFYQDTIGELDDLKDDQSTDNLNVIIDILNSYINLVGVEIEKIFPDFPIRLEPIENKDFNLNEIQIIEILQGLNKGDRDIWQIKGNLEELAELVFEDSFQSQFWLTISQLISNINAELTVWVDNLL